MNGIIQVPKFPELKFDDRTHVYTLEKAQIPSVTKIMRPLTESYYGGIDGDVLAAAAKRGTAVHQAIENHLRYGIDDIPPEHEGYYQAYKAWWDEKKPQLLETESRVYHRIYRYAGTADLTCLVENGLLFCVDFKTSAQIAEMLVRVQLEAYSRAYDSHGFHYDAKAVVHLQKDGRWSMKAFPSGDLESWEVFCSLLTVQNYLKTYGR
jgi:hypothetical protein